MTLFTKYAEITATLQPHQQKAVDKALLHNLLLAHSTGSGKTLTSIAIADRLGVPATVLTPASLVDNYVKEIANFKRNGPPIEVLSLPTAQLRKYQIPKGNTLIIDEAHSIRNPNSKRFKYVQEQANNADRVFGLTGTPAYNTLENWAPLLNIVSKKDLFPTNPDEFRKRYTKRDEIDPSKIVLQNRDELKQLLSSYVDVFDKDIEKPERIDEIISVPMSKYQQHIYDFVAGKEDASWEKYLKKRLPEEKQDSEGLNAYLSGVRQVANTAQGFNTNSSGLSPKLQEALRQIRKHLKENPELRAFVYSNYLNSGVAPLAKALDRYGISNAIFHGDLSKRKKKKLVDLYNKGKLHVLLGTGSASEGLDLKKTNLLQILEPHFNNARIEQVIGRGIRYKSHEGLPKDQQKVIVQQFESTRRPTWKEWFSGSEPAQTVDRYLKHRADEKDELIKQVKELFN